MRPPKVEWRESVVCRAGGPRSPVLRAARVGTSAGGLARRQIGRPAGRVVWCHARSSLCSVMCLNGSHGCRGLSNLVPIRATLRPPRQTTLFTHCLFFVFLATSTSGVFFCIWNQLDFSLFSDDDSLMRKWRKHYNAMRYVRTWGHRQ